MAFVVPARTPKLDGPIGSLQRELDDMIGELFASVQGEDETRIVSEVDLLARIQQHRRAVVLLKKAEYTSTMQRPAT